MNNVTTTEQLTAALGLLHDRVQELMTLTAMVANPARHQGLDLDALANDYQTAMMAYNVALEQVTVKVGVDFATVVLRTVVADGKA